MRAVLAILLVLVPAASAQAGTLAYTDFSCDPRSGCPSKTRFFAEQGERNVVTIELRGEQVLVRDEAVPLGVAGGCTALDAHTATCRADEGFAADTGDGDDVVRSTGAVIGIHLGTGDDEFVGAGDVRGDDGNDRLTASAAADRLAGGPGDDVLDGGAGPDDLTGGPGRDSLLGGAGDDLLEAGEGLDVPAVADALDGGPGADVASWSQSPAGVVVDLADREPDGVPGAAETLTGIEGAGGTWWTDRIAGDDGPNWLAAGGNGRDVVDGRGGADRIFSGGTVRCGDGSDTFTRSLKRFTLPRDCEWTNLLDQRVKVGVRKAGRRLRIDVICKIESRATLTVRAGRATTRRRACPRAAFTVPNRPLEVTLAKRDGVVQRFRTEVRL